MSKRVLIADSEEWSLDLISSVASELKHEVTEARNGVEAIQKFKMYSPDIVFIDNLLPKVDGFQVVKNIKQTELGKVTPIILMSPIYRKGEESRELLYLYNLAGFLEKPFERAEVEKILREYLSDIPEAKVEPLDSEVEEKKWDYRPEYRLEVYPVPALLNEIHRNRKSGVLYLSLGEITKNIQFENGMITAARSNSSRDRIGRILFKNGKIKREDLQEAMEIQKKDAGKNRLGNILLSLGVVKEEDLTLAIQSQAIMILLGLFEWDEGYFHFLETAKLRSDFPLLNINPLEIIFWGLRRLEGKKNFEPLLPDPKVVVKKTKEGDSILESVHLTYFEQQVLFLIDGRRTLREIATLGRLSQIDVPRVMYTFLTVGILTEGGKPEPQARQVFFPPGLHQAASDPGIPSRGKIEKFPIPRLVMRIHRERRTGILNLKRDGISKYLIFEDGDLNFAKSTDENDRIGNILLGSGLVSMEDCKRVVEEHQRKKGNRIGNLFIESGILSLEQLHMVIRFQIQQILMSVISWENGDFLFVEGKIPTSESITLDAPLPKVLVECLRKIHVTPYILSFLPPESAVLALNCDGYQAGRALNLSIPEVRVLSRIEKGITIKDLRTLSFLEKNEIDRILYAFLSLGIVRVSDVKALSPERELKKGESADKKILDSAKTSFPGDFELPFPNGEDFDSVESFSLTPEELSKGNKVGTSSREEKAKTAPPQKSEKKKSDTQPVERGRPEQKR